MKKILCIILTIFVIVLTISGCASIETEELNNSTEKEEIITSTDSESTDKEIEKERIYGETDESKMTEEQIEQMGKTPKYFGLEATYGLDVYVYQLAPEAYYFMLYEHGAEGPTLQSGDLIHLSGVNKINMRIILSTYPIDNSQIYIIPFTHPLSSYIGEYFVYQNEEEKDVKMEKYKNIVREMLFGNEETEN